MVRFLLSVGADPGLVSAAGSCVAIAPTPLIRTILQDVMKGEREGYGAGGGGEHDEEEDGANTLVVEIGMSDGIDKVSRRDCGKNLNPFYNIV